MVDPPPTNLHNQKEDQESIKDGYYSVYEEKIVVSEMLPLQKTKIIICEDWRFQKEKINDI